MSEDMTHSSVESVGKKAKDSRTYEGIAQKGQGKWATKDYFACIVSRDGTGFIRDYSSGA